MTKDCLNVAFSSGASVIAGTLTITQMQPVITMVSGLVAIFWGIVAIIYYRKATRNLNITKNFDSLEADDSMVGELD